MPGPRRYGRNARPEVIGVCAASACWSGAFRGRIIRFSTSVGSQVGTVTSGTHSPVLGEGIGLAYLQRGVQKIGTQVYIDMKGKRQPAEVAKLPFVASGY